MFLAGLLSATVVAAPQVARTLDCYFIDVEGGQATLVVTPAGESMLIDAGFPGDVATIAPGFNEASSAPDHPRDPERVLAAAKAAGLTRIDYVMMTHSHADHGGGIREVAARIPIGTFIDHMPPTDEAEKNVKGTRTVYDRYLEAGRGKAHIEPHPGARLPLKGVDARIVSANGAVPSSPLPGGGQTNPACAGTGVPAQERFENPFSNGLRIQFGRFRLLNVGDLSGDPLFKLGCPVNLVGEVEVYLVTHHGGNDASDPSLFKALNPLVSIFNNGVRKGAQADTMNTVNALGLETWQLHKTANANAPNAPDERIANLDESTANWLKLSAKEDGSFTITNPRTGQVKSYTR